MRVRLVLLVGVVVAASLVMLQLRGGLRLLAWSLVVLVAMSVVVWRSWPLRRNGAGSLWFGSPRPVVTSGRVTANLEMEISGAMDPVLGADGPLRRRLVELVRQRTDPAARLSADDLARVLGEGSARQLLGQGPFDLAKIDELVTRIEEL